MILNLHDEFSRAGPADFIVSGIDTKITTIEARGLCSFHRFFRTMTLAGARIRRKGNWPPYETVIKAIRRMFPNLQCVRLHEPYREIWVSYVKQKESLLLREKQSWEVIFPRAKVEIMWVRYLDVNIDMMGCLPIGR